MTGHLHVRLANSLVLLAGLRLGLEACAGVKVERSVALARPEDLRGRCIEVARVQSLSSCSRWPHLDWVCRELLLGIRGEVTVGSSCRGSRACVVGARIERLA